MNLLFLGDALDHWKGSVLESLQRAGILSELLVDAMASDADSWTRPDWELFSKLMRIKPIQVIGHTANLHNRRRDYFLEVPAVGDLFLDPDTGIRTGKVKNPRQYLEAAELGQLLDANTSRLVAVYQHVRAKKTRDRVEEVLRYLPPAIGRFSCASYESGTVAMLFFSRDKSRVTDLRDYLSDFLGSHAERRVGCW